MSDPARSHRAARAWFGPVTFCAGFTTVFVFAAFVLARGSLTLRRWDIRITSFAGWYAFAMGLLLAALNAGWLTRLPGALREFRFHPRIRRLGAAGPFVMGVAFGFGWTPCLGPVLTAILGLAATSGAELSAVTNMLAYAAGLAVPFLAVGIGLERTTPALRWFRRHSRVVGIVSGLALAAFGLALASGSITWLAIWSQRYLGSGADGAFGVEAGATTTVLVSFVFGFLSFVSPCVLPLVPGYVALATGDAARRAAGTEAARRSA